jgi:hypothetical protein
MILQSASAVWAEINIEASVNPARVAVGEPVELSISITGASSGIKTPKLPELKDFRSYSQGHSEEFSFINGKSTSRSVFTFVMIPSAEGTFVIDGIQVPIGDKVFKTGALKIEVGPSNTVSTPPVNQRGKPIAQVVPPSSRSLPPEYMASQEIFVRAWSDREEVYVNQPIYLTYTLYTRTSATFKGFEDEPETAGFWVEDFPPNPQASRQERNLGGYRYVIADVRQVALFPTEAGLKTFNPGSLKVDVEITRNPYGNSSPFQGTMFGRPRFSQMQMLTEIQPRVLETEPINFKVKPLPEAGKPEGFGGAVGRFKIAASTDQTKVEEGHPVTFKLKVTGEGNLNTLEMPKPLKLDGFKSYDSSSGLDLRKERMTIEGDKTLETVLVPRKAGAYTIPSVNFSYFDPVKETYITLKTQPILLTVDPAPAGEEPPKTPEPILPAAPSPSTPNTAASGAQDIRYVKSVMGSVGRVARPALTERWFWMLNAAVLLTALIFLTLRLTFERLGINLLGAKPKRFKGEAVKSFRAAKRAIKPGSEKDFYEAIAKGVYGYFADKLRVEISAVGIGRVDELLRGKVSEAEMDQIRELFHRIDYGRFSTVRVPENELKQLYNDSERIVMLVDKKRL